MSIHTIGDSHSYGGWSNNNASLYVFIMLFLLFKNIILLKVLNIHFWEQMKNENNTFYILMKN
jgi:hypothetical protein